VVLEGRIDGLSIAGFRNKLTGQATEYVEAADPSEAFGANGTRADRQLYVRQ